MSALAQAGSEIRQRRLALFALFLVAAFNYVDRTILSVLQIPIKAELGLSDSQLGALTGFTFALFYSFLALPIARLADRYSRRLILVASLVLWSSMTALCGVASGFLSLAFFRIGVAIGEAGGAPASASLIADYYPPAERGKALSTYGLALPIGMLVGYAGIGLLASAVGWRLAFVTIGTLGVLLGPVVLRLLREPARGTFDPPATAAAPRLPILASLGLLWRTPAYRFVVIAGMFHGFSQYSMMTWNAPFFARSHGLSLAQVALLMALLSGVAGAIGMYGSGWLGDRLALKEPRWRVWIMAASVGATVPFSIAQYLLPSTGLSIAAAAFSAALMIAYYGPIVATTQSAVPPTMRAFANAVLLLVFSLVGLGLGPWITGMISDALTPALGQQALRYALLVATSGSLLSAFIFVYAGRYWTAEAMPINGKDPHNA